MTRGMMVLVACLSLAWAACDSGGVISRDVFAPDAASPDEGPGLVVDTLEDPGVAESLDVTLDDPLFDTPVADAGPEVTVIPRPYIPAKSFRLEPAGWEGEYLVVHLVARDFGAIFGVALRVEWDPSVLVLQDASLEPVFGEEGKAAIYRAAEVRPGSLAMAWALLGSKEFAISKDVRFATLKFAVQRPTFSEIAFFEPRCLVLTRRLDKVAAVYLSAVVSP